MIEDCPKSFAIDWNEFYRNGGSWSIIFRKAQEAGQDPITRFGLNLIELFGTEALKTRCKIGSVPQSYLPQWGYRAAETIFLPCRLMDILWAYSEEHNMTIREMVARAVIA